MQHTILWTFSLSAVLAIGLTVGENRAAAQTFDPVPIDDEASGEMELPLSPRLGDDLQGPRDYSHAYLGVTFDPEIGDAAVARSVNAGSPADQAGLRAGDTIVSLNGRRVGSYQAVLKVIGELRPGEVLDIDASRRVSVRARAVLDGQPLDGRTSVYRLNGEALPVPADYRERPRPSNPQYKVNTPRPPQYNGAAVNRRNEVNRNNGPSQRDRDNRNRARAPRRRN